MTGGPKAAWATECVIQKLRTMWDGGVSTKTIGDALGVSKNMIVSMSRTLGLMSRPSPIPGGAAGGAPKSNIPYRSAADRRASRAVPALVYDRANPGLSALDDPRPSGSFTASDPVPPAPRRVVVGATRSAPGSRPRGERGPVLPCCWVMTLSIGGRLPVYCDADSMPGFPYCEEHAALAYPSVRQRLLRERTIKGGVGR